jgi:hypothetical protein
MKLTSVVPWGRTLGEYQRMFSLTDMDFQKKLLGCGDGPASFNAEMTAAGYRVTSVDPVYQFSKEEIESRVRDTYDTIIAQVKENIDSYIWDYFKNPDELGKARLAAMNSFLLDYDRGRTAGRYLPLSLPNLSDISEEFDLGLCSHFLFLYSDKLSQEFHIESIRELLRICREVRIFPLLTLDCQLSPYLEPTIAALEAANYIVSIEPVTYEFQKGGDRMIKISHSSNF